MAPVKLTAVVIDPNPDGRVRLREIIKSCVEKTDLSLYPSIKEGLSHISKEKNPEFIFVSLNSGIQPIREFINNLKDKLGEKIPHIVLTLENQSLDGINSVATLTLDGIAGAIAAPFSVESLDKLLETVSQQSGGSDLAVKRKKAAKLLINEAIQVLDPLAESAHDIDAQPGTELRDLRKISDSMKIIQSQFPELYAETVIELFEASKPPNEGVKPTRHGGSKDKVTHPAIKVAKLIQERSLAVEKLPLSPQVTVGEFSDFLNCRRGIDEPLAADLARIFGGTAKEWIQHQLKYDFIQLRIKQREKMWERKK